MKKEIHMGEQLQELMYARKMNVSDVATKIGRSELTVRRMLKRKHFQLGMLLRVSRLFDVPLLSNYVQGYDEQLEQERKANQQLKNTTTVLKEQLETAYANTHQAKANAILAEEKYEELQLKFTQLEAEHEQTLKQVQRLQHELELQQNTIIHLREMNDVLTQAVTKTDSVS